MYICTPRMSLFARHSKNTNHVLNDFSSNGSRMCFLIRRMSSGASCVSPRGVRARSPRVFSLTGVSSCAERSPLLTPTRSLPQTDRAAGRSSGSDDTELGTCAGGERGWACDAILMTSARTNRCPRRAPSSQICRCDQTEPPAFRRKTLFPPADAPMFTPWNNWQLPTLPCLPPLRSS